MNDLFVAAQEFDNCCETAGINFCIIGGLAVVRWGEIRLTQDIDICVLCGFGNEDKRIDDLLRAFRPRIDHADLFAKQNRVLLVRASNNIAIDISLSGISFEEDMIRRASKYAFAENFFLRTCAAEDLIVLKAFADRNKDWTDIEGIVIRQNNRLDRAYIFRQLAPLCELKEAPEIMERLKKMLPS